jgi:hypothetical protein
MIVRLFCPICTLNAKQSGIPAVVDTVMPFAEIRDDGIYEIQCASSHTTRVALRNVKFEILFELALNGLMDGYPREAVSSFTAALERFYEFFICVTNCHFGITPEENTKAWKSVSNQSERQLGMFISSYLQLTKRAPNLLSNVEVKFRNDVIHKGEVPSRGAAAKYGDAVEKIINEGLAELRSNAMQAMDSTYKSLLPKLIEKHPDEIIGGTNIVTPVDVNNPVTSTDDLRYGGALKQFPRLQKERSPHRMSLLNKEDLRKRVPEEFKKLFPGES